MRVHGRLRVIQSSKHKSPLLFNLQTLISFFQILISSLPSSRRRLEADLAGLPMLDRPRVLPPRRGPSRDEVRWFRQYRSCTPIKPIIATGQTDRSSGDQKLLHVVVFMFNDTFRCQHKCILKFRRFKLVFHVVRQSI
jgi:hypothetical protein